MTPQDLMTAWLLRQLPPDAATWLTAQRDRLRAAFRFAHDFEIILQPERRREAAAYDVMIVGDENADALGFGHGQAGRGTVAESVVPLPVRPEVASLGDAAVCGGLALFVVAGMRRAPLRYRPGLLGSGPPAGGARTRRGPGAPETLAVRRTPD